MLAEPMQRYTPASRRLKSATSTQPTPRLLHPPTLKNFPQARFSYPPSPPEGLGPSAGKCSDIRAPFFKPFAVLVGLDGQEADSLFGKRSRIT
jgi:hypothetical protein